MKPLAPLSLVGLALALAGCGGSGGPEAFSATSYESAVIEGVDVPPPPGEGGEAAKAKTKTRRGLQQGPAPLGKPPQD